MGKQVVWDIRDRADVLTCECNGVVWCVCVCVGGVTIKHELIRVTFNVSLLPVYSLVLNKKNYKYGR